MLLEEEEGERRERGGREEGERRERGGKEEGEGRKRGGRGGREADERRMTTKMEKTGMEKKTRGQRAAGYSVVG
eukprot:754200-Hanusia_phi.AAC.9